MRRFEVEGRGGNAGAVGFEDQACKCFNLMQSSVGTAEVVNKIVIQLIQESRNSII